jgi:hypothetical protein
MTEVKYEKTEDEYMKEIEIINEMFPDALFSVCIDLNIMNNVLSDNDVIIIKSDYSCFCYREFPRNTDFFIIRSPHNGKITYKHVFTELMNQGLNLMDQGCDHIYIEDIALSGDSDCQFEFWLGS